MILVLEKQLEKVKLDFTNLSFSKYEKDLMEEDRDLVRAAWCTDRLVISLDEEVRRLFARASQASQVLHFLQRIMWSNPDSDTDCIRWINAGAPEDKARMLGAIAEET